MGGPCGRGGVAGIDTEERGEGRGRDDVAGQPWQNDAQGISYNSSSGASSDDSVDQSIIPRRVSSGERERLRGGRSAWVPGRVMLCPLVVREGGGGGGAQQGGPVGNRGMVDGEEAQEGQQSVHTRALALADAAFCSSGGHSDGSADSVAAGMDGAAGAPPGTKKAASEVASGEGSSLLLWWLQEQGRVVGASLGGHKLAGAAHTDAATCAWCERRGGGAVTSSAQCECSAVPLLDGMVVRVILSLRQEVRRGGEQPSARGPQFKCVHESQLQSAGLRAGSQLSHRGAGSTVTGRSDRDPAGEGEALQEALFLVRFGREEGRAVDSGISGGRSGGSVEEGDAERADRKQWRGVGRAGRGEVAG